MSCLNVTFVLVVHSTLDGQTFEQWSQADWSMVSRTMTWFLPLFTGTFIRIVIARAGSDKLCVCRYERWAIRVAGTTAVKVRGVENIDLSDIVESHGDYINRMPAILEYVRFDSNDPYKFV
jgi:hypothetical protein